MPTRLYPPQINGTLPAFYKSYDASTGVLKDTQITIPFTASALVSEADIVGFSLRLKTSSTNTYLFEPVESTNYNIANSTVTFTLPSSKGSLLNEGQYYKVQIAYISKYTDEEIVGTNEDGTIETQSVFKKLTGYYSTVGIIKCVQKPSVSIKGYSIDSINLFNNEIFGLYELSSDYDQTEKVYSYNFSFYTEDGELYYSTGELLHNNSNDNEYGLSIDSVILSSFIKTSEVYKLTYTVTTINGLVVSSPMYRVTAETLLPPSKNLSIATTPQPDSGSIKINFQGNEHITRQENVIQEMVRKEIYYHYDESLKRKLKKFYYGSDIETNSSKIKNYVTRIRTASYLGIVREYRQYLKDNLALLNEMSGISTGILESFFDTSTEYMLYLGDYLEKVINNIGQKNESRNYETLNNQFLKDTATYIITLSDGYKGLTAALKRRLDSYISYLLDLIDKDETFIDSNVEDQTMLTLSQTIVSTVELSTELAVEYLSILGYKAKIVYEEEKSEDTYFGQYMLVRASEEDDYRSWIELKRFKLENMRPSLVNYVDYTVKQGVKYIYGIVQYNLFGIYSSRIESKPVSVDFEDIFLYDGERVLKIKFNPKISSFKTTILEQKTNTIGNKYPFIFRNGNVAYKEFPISGLISYQMDDELLFYDYEINEYFRECTENSNRSNSEDFFFEMAQILENPCDLIENNIHKERDFKTEVLDWLNNGKPKLFKSGPEGNFIVRIMNVSLSPIDTLGRMLHSFSGQCAEIAEFNYDNLLRYGFIKADVVNKYVFLWKSYYLNEYEPGKDIELFFESSISNFSVQDLKPGSSIFLTYGDVSSKEEDEIIIGITGAYSYDSSRLITKIRIPNSVENHPVGILECQYQGTRYGAFDAITSMSLKTILSNQFIGVDPVLDELATFSSQSHFLQSADIKKFNDAIKSINDRIILNNFENKAITDVYDKLNANGFEAGDIIQHINASFYNHEKSKVRILNLERLKLRVRELIPIYAVPYDYINRTGWSKLPDSVTYWLSNGISTGVCSKQLDGSYSRYDYEHRFPSQNLLYSVTPFGEPFPIDELTPIVQKYFDINDEFCVFHLYEYFPQYDTWMPTQRKNIFGVKTGEYYDCYWSSIINDYDTSYYIDDKYRYEKIDEILRDEETGEYYTLVQNQKKVFSDDLDLFVKFNGEYVSANSIYYFPTYSNEDGSITYYTYIKNDDSRIDDIEYLSQSVRWLNKENYNPVPGYYHNNWTIDENNRAKSIVREADMKDFYLRYENAILLEDGQTAEFTNLGSPSIIKIGTGLIAEATFQLEILDYYTEKNNDATFIAKENYTTKAEFLRNFYRNFELIAEADSNFQRYFTLARMYRTLLTGLADKANYPYENINTYQSNYESNINYQDRSITNAILNSDKPGEDQNVKIAEVWAESDLPENTKLEVKQKVNETIGRMQINKAMKTELELQDEEEGDLYDLIKSATKEGINAKLGKLNELYQMLSESKNKTVSEGQTYASDYAKLLSALQNAVNAYNNKIYNYKAAYWLYCLIYWKIGKVIAKEMPAEKTLLSELTYEEALELESKISINDILISISNHYNRVQNASGADNVSTFAEALNTQKNYYITAWSGVKSAVSSILTYTSIINDKQGDQALDELLLNKIADNTYNMLLYYWQMKNARDNIYGLLGVTVPDNGEDELFIKQIGLDGESYYFNNVKNLIKSIENLIVNDEDVSQPTPKKLFKTTRGVLKGLLISHNLLRDKLQMNNGRWGFTDEEVEEIKEYVKSVDKLDYVTSAADDLGWDHTYYKGKPNPAEISKTMVYLIPAMTSLQSDIDLYQLAVVFRERILNAFYCQDNSSSVEAYIASISSSGQASIKGTRDIIPSTDDDIIDDGDADLYISNDFDKTYQSIEDRNIKARKIAALLNIIDNLKASSNEKNYREILDSLSLQISSTANEIAPLVSNCYEEILGSEQSCLGKILEAYNIYLSECQTNLLKNADWQDYYEVENLTIEDYEKFKNHWYLSDKGQIDNGTYSINAHYYLKLKDYLLFKFIKYYTGLNLSDKDRLDSFDEYYNTLVNYLTDGNLVAKFDQMQENSLKNDDNSFYFDNANFILAETEVKVYNTLLEQSIEYDNNSRQTFIGAVVSGNNAFRDLPQIATNFNNINNDLLDKLLSGYKNDTLHKPFINGKDSAISGLTKDALTITAAEDSNLNYLLVLDRVIKTVGLYYWANVSRFKEYDLPLLQMEFYTNTSMGKSSDIIDDNYSSITAMGIIYWYLQYVVNKEINALEDALKQAETLNIIYTNKQTNYQQKQEQYENLYLQYLEVYKNFLGTDYFEYYNSSADEKDNLMRELIQSVKDAWNEFVLALDRGYTAEVKAGMYQ